MASPAKPTEAAQSSTGSPPPSPPATLPRLELRVERLKLTLRFTFAFHAREVRFESDHGEGFQRIFPETFSFHRDRHDPTEFILQLDDLLQKPRLLGPRGTRRDARGLVVRLLSEVPRYLEELCESLESGGRITGATRLRVHQDLALLSQLLLRFIDTRDLGENRALRMAAFVLRRRIFRSLRVLLCERVTPEYLDGYVAGEVDPVDPADDPTESGFFFALESGTTDVADRMIVRMAERAFYLWAEAVCLDEDNQAFEKEDSIFATREAEVLDAITTLGVDSIHRGRDLAVFLRRPTKDCMRILKGLERFFLRRYDIRHSSAIIHYAAALERRAVEPGATLTWHTPRLHAASLALLVSPFVGAVFFYDRAPRVFDWLCSAEVVLVNAIAVWFLVYRFCWKRDLSFFHASVPRIGAGIIVGYLPVFLIDEVWDLASRSTWAIQTLAVLLGLVTLLYIYVEVQRRLGETELSFRRARAIFLLGVVEAFGVGLVMTSLVGRFMVSRNWSPDGTDLPVEQLRGSMEPVLGALPQVMGVEPFYIFPSALTLMTLLSFFIGIFLQLMWEELPITEPL